MLLVGVAIAGCTRSRYLIQAAHGQYRILDRRRPIEAMLDAPSTPPHLRQLLLHVEPVKQFARRHGLRPAASYSDYADIGRPAAVWVVTASRPLELVPRTWSFPIAGSFPYLGWFDRGDALRFAASLAEDGWDVDVRGSPAYSTLGWFSDPILSSMISRRDTVVGDLVNDVLHESVHATVHIPAQSVFNENVATFVADRLTLVYLEGIYGPGAPETAAYTADQDRRVIEDRLLSEAYAALATLYAAAEPEQAKLARKLQVLSSLRSALGWRRAINNATLARFRTYRTGAPELDELLAACDHDWPRLLTALSTLSPESFPHEQQAELRPVLAPLLSSCGRKDPVPAPR